MTDPPATSEPMADAIERLRPKEQAPRPAPARVPKPPPPRLPMQPLWVASAAAVVLVGAWGANDVMHLKAQQAEVVVLGSAVTRSEPVATLGTPASSSTPSTVVTVTTATTATTVPAPVVVVTSPAPTTTTSTPPTTRPPTTTTTAPRPATPLPVLSSSSSVVVGGVQLTLSAAPPASESPRTAEFRLVSEFGDARVMRSLQIDFGDGTTPTLR